MAARLACLAAPNTVVMGQVTTQRAQGTCALEDVASQALTSVSIPDHVDILYELVEAG